MRVLTTAPCPTGDPRLRVGRRDHDPCGLVAAAVRVRTLCGARARDAARDAPRQLRGALAARARQLALQGQGDLGTRRMRPNRRELPRLRPRRVHRHDDRHLVRLHALLVDALPRGAGARPLNASRCVARAAEGGSCDRDLGAHPHALVCGLDTLLGRCDRVNRLGRRRAVRHRDGSPHHVAAVAVAPPGPLLRALLHRCLWPRLGLPLPLAEARPVATPRAPVDSRGGGASGQRAGWACPLSRGPRQGGPDALSLGEARLDLP